MEGDWSGAETKTKGWKLPNSVGYYEWIFIWWIWRFVFSDILKFDSNIDVYLDLICDNKQLGWKDPQSYMYTNTTQATMFADAREFDKILVAMSLPLILKDL